MKPGLTEGIASLEKCLSLTTTGWKNARAAEASASELCRCLLDLCPQASLAACLVPLADLPRGVVCSRESNSPQAIIPTSARQSIEEALTARLIPPGHHLLVERATVIDQPVSMALAMPEGPAEENAFAHRLLALCCRQLAHHLDQQAEAEELQLLADLGVLAGPMTHEFNNFVNIVLLQAAILEADSLDHGREELIRLRQHGKAVTQVIQEWHRCRGRQQIDLHPVDLHTAIQHVVACWNDEVVDKIHLELMQRIPSVLATSADLIRLLRFLLRNALAVASTVTIRTSVAGETILLRVEDDGPTVPPEQLVRFFEPVALRPGTVGLELAACESIVRRRWQGRITAENCAPGGIAITVQLRSAATGNS